MSLRFAEVEPPTGHALCRSGFVELPHPVHRLGVGGIYQSYLVCSEPSHVCHVLIGEIAFLTERLVVHGIGSEERFGDADGLYALLVEVGEHLLRVVPIRLIPVEVSHSRVFGTLPIQVEDDSIDGQSGCLYGTYHPFGFLSCPVSVSGSYVS